MEKDWNNIKTVLGIRLYRENERNNYFLINFLDKHQIHYSIIKINNDYFILKKFVIAFEDYFNKFFKKIQIGLIDFMKFLTKIKK